MKLRLAQPEYLIDINDLDELSYIRRDRRRGPDRGADPPRRARAQRRAGPPLPAVRRRRGGDRRSGGPQPRHDRRQPVPGRRRRGPELGVLGGQGPGGDPRRRRRPGGGHGRVPPRPVHDRGRRRGDGDRDPDPAARGRRQLHTRRSSGAPATGRSRPPRRRCGSTAARSPTPASRSAPSARPRSTCLEPRSCSSGASPSDELFAQAAEIASADCSPTADGRGPVDYKRHLAGVLAERATRIAASRALRQEA